MRRRSVVPHPHMIGGLISEVDRIVHDGDAGWFGYRLPELPGEFNPRSVHHGLRSGGPLRARDVAPELRELGRLAESGSPGAVAVAMDQAALR